MDGDTPNFDVLTAAFDTTGTTMQVADTNSVRQTVGGRESVQNDGDPVDHRRHAHGRVARPERLYGCDTRVGGECAVRPAFTSQEISESLNQSLMTMWPKGVQAHRRHVPDHHRQRVRVPWCRRPRHI